MPPRLAARTADGATAPPGPAADAAAPGIAASATATLDTAAPDTAAPDTAAPDTAALDTAALDTAAADAAAAASGLRRILRISTSLVGTHAATSVLGLVFWTLASRQFLQAEFGIANAAVSAMGLISALGTLGLGTLLIARLPHTDQAVRRVTVRTALLVAGIAGTALAVLVPFVTIHLLGVGNLGPIAASPGHAALFAAGTGLAGVALVLDQAVLVLGSGSLQLERNVLASATKVLALVLLAGLGLGDGMGIFAAWAVGTLVSLPLVAHRTRGGRPLQASRSLVDLSVLRGMGRSALSHHALNTTLQSPLLLLPIIVTAAVSARANAPFGAAIQLTGFVFALPYALSIGLFAAAEGRPHEVLRRMRVTIPLGLAVSAVADAVLFPLAPWVMGIFGPTYAADGANVLRVLVLAGLPFVVKDHFVALRRVQDRTGQATGVMVAFTAAEIAAALVGALTHGVLGLCVAWVGILVVEAAVLAVPLLSAQRSAARLVGDPGAPVEAVAAGAAVDMSRPEIASVLTTTGPDPLTTTGPDPLTTTGPDPLTTTAPGPASAGERRRVPAGLARLAPGAVVVTMSLGLLAMALAASAARRTGDDGWATELGWELGLVLIVGPAAVAAAWPRAGRATGAVLAVAAAVALQLSRVVLYPTRFMFHDELIHANVLRQIQDSGRLFADNPLLPISGYYPGLEVATAGVADVTGLSAHTSAVVVLLACRLVLALAVLLVVTRLTGSSRAGAVAVVVYSVNPQMLFFNSQFSYQSIALPLAVLTIWLFLSRDSNSDSDRGRRAALILPVAAMAAVTASHHVTALLLILVFAGWTVLEAALRRGRPREVGALATMTVSGVVFFGLTLLNPGNTLVSYLDAIGTSSATDLDSLAQGRQTKALFANGAGFGPAPWERVLLLVSLALTVAVLVPALWKGRWWVRRRVTAAVLLGLVAVLYPVIPGGHVARATAEVGDRASGFVFVGVSFIVAWWLVRDVLRRRRGAVVFGIGATVAFLGSVVLGAGPVAGQLPGPFLVSADARSIDAATISAAQWMRRTLPPDSRVYADRDTGLLVAADGGMFTVLHISTGVDASRLLLDPAYGRTDVQLIRAAGIRYLVVDRRDATGLPNQGVYVESGEFGAQDRTKPVPLAALEKFDHVPGVDRIYDNGPIVIYDLAELDR